MNQIQKISNDEEFRIIEDYPDYMVSNYGRVYTCKRNKFMKPRKHLGYLSVGLRSKKCKKCKRFSIHRLVAKAFIPNPENLPFINHRDEVKTNNHIDNLEWCTLKYNVNYGTAIQRRLEKIHGKYGRSVLQYTLEGEFIKKWNSIKEAVISFGKNKRSTSINDCVKHRCKTAYGYIWKYEQ